MAPLTKSINSERLVIRQFSKNGRDGNESAMANHLKLPSSLATLLTGLLLLAACDSRAPSTPDHNIGPAIDSIATAALTSGPVAGLSIAVVREGEIIYASGYGSADLEGARDATRETVYVAASVTKMLTALAALTLVHDGRLTLDDTLADLLPAYPNPEQARVIRLRHLLNHTSGLHDLLDSPLLETVEQGQPIVASAVLEWLKDQPLDFEPGTHWMYSNTAFYLVGLIIEEVSGLTYGDFVRDRVARPLGLHDTFLCDDWLLPERRTVGYEPADGGLTRTDTYETTGAKTGFGAAGGFCSTAIDLAMLPTALSESALLPDSLLQEMRTPTTLDTYATVDYGFGVRLGELGGQALWGHSGGSASTWAMVTHYPAQDVTVSVMMNTDRSRADAWLVQGRVARTVLGIDPPTVDSVATVDIARYQGHYIGGRGDRNFELTARGGRLLIKETGSAREPTPTVPVGNDKFAIATSPTDHLAFSIREGQVLGYSVYWDGVFWNYRRAAN